MKPKAAPPGGVKAPPQHPFSAGYEQEKQELARQVHDEMGQPLTVLKFIIGRLLTAKQSEPLLAEAAKLVGQLQAEVRTLCLRLQPPADSRDLTSVPDSRGKVRSGRMVVNFPRIEMVATLSLPVGIAQAILSVIREALNNAQLHGAAREATVKLLSEKGQVVLQIEDNGSGFDPLRIDSRSGIARMQEAARRARGKLSIESAPETGTRVIAIFPLERKRRTKPLRPGKEPRA